MLEPRQAPYVDDSPRPSARARYAHRRRRLPLPVLMLLFPLLFGSIFALDVVGVHEEVAVGTVVGKDLTDHGSWRLDLSFAGHRQVALVPASVYDNVAVGGPVLVTFRQARLDGVQVSAVEPARN